MQCSSLATLVLTNNDIDGIELLMGALDTHADDAGVVEAACGAVRKLAVNIDNKIAIAEAGGIERLMAALDTHAGLAGVVEAAVSYTHLTLPTICSV